MGQAIETAQLLRLKLFLAEKPQLSESHTTDIEANGLPRGVLTMDKPASAEIVNGFINGILADVWPASIDFNDPHMQQLDAVNVTPSRMGLVDEWRLIMWNYDRRGALMLFKREADKYRVLDALAVAQQ